ncbi:MAG TPA: DUF4870 domain-containing protein [Phycisphaerales bacterium]|nr:DUF4870 domain-containing protein [Phycisphaerales bacterium]
MEMTVTAVPNVQMMDAFADAPARPAVGPVHVPMNLASSGRLRASDVSDTDKTFAIFMNLALFGTFIIPGAFIAPLVLWMIRKDKSAFADDHGRETTNLMITALIVYAATVPAVLASFGLLSIVTVIWQIVIAIAMIRGAIAAGNREYFRYPMIIRFIK